MSLLATSFGKYVAVSALLLATAGCSDVGLCPEAYLCDIRDSACQKTLMHVAACLYDAPEIVPPIRIVSEQDYIAEEMAGVEKATVEDRLEYERLMRALALFGFVPQGLTLKEATAADLDRSAGFYRLDDRQITIIDRGVPLNEISPILTLVHEFIHALQHESTDVFDHPTETTDEYLALAAITEGEASFYEDRAAVEGLGWHVEDLDLTESYSSWQTQSILSYFENSDSLHVARTYFVYPYGAGHAYRAWKTGGNAKIAERRAAIPDSVHPFLTDADDSLASAKSVHEALGDEALPKLPSSFARLDYDGFGPWLLLPLINYLESEMIGEAVAFASKSRGDSISWFYNKDDDAVFSIWRLRFVTAGDADTLVQAVNQSGKSMRAWPEERDAIILAADNKEYIDTYFQKLEWEAAPVQSPGDNKDARAKRTTVCTTRSTRSVFTMH